MRQAYGAILTLEFFAAGATHRNKGVTTPVQQDHRLLASIECRLSFSYQRARKQLFLASLLKLLAHIHNFHAR